MSKQDEAFFSTFKIVLGVLVLMAVIFYVVAKFAAGLAEPEASDEASRAMVAERIAPVGEVRVGEAPIETASQDGGEAAALSAKQVVSQVCAACHQTGTLGAPKIGTKADWTSRVDKGMDTLVDHAVNGFKQMPPKGGDTSLSEDEIREAVVYMLEESGLSTGEAGSDGAEKTASAASKPATDAEEQPAPAAGGKQTASADAAKTQAATETPGAGGDIVPAGIDIDQGRKIYSQACMSCHDTGAAGAPKKGNASAWEPRIAKGWDTLTHHALNGFNAMPAKGGRADLPDDDVKAAVAYIIEQSR